MGIKIAEQEVVENLIDSMLCSADTFKIFLTPHSQYEQDEKTRCELYSFLCEMLELQVEEIREYIEIIKKFSENAYLVKSGKGKN